MTSVGATLAGVMSAILDAVQAGDVDRARRLAEVARELEALGLGGAGGGGAGGAASAVPERARGN